MHKELIIVAVILSAMFTINFIAMKYLNKKIDIISFKLSEISNIIRDEILFNKKIDDIDLDIKLLDLENDWNNSKNKLANFIEHDELEKVDSSMVKSKYYIDIKEYEEVVPELNNCIYILNHIKDKESVKLINLF